MHAPLHPLAPDSPSRKFGIVRSNGHEARFPPLDQLSIMVIRLPDEQFSIHLIQDAQPVRFLWHLQRGVERLRFHLCRVEIVGMHPILTALFVLVERRRCDLKDVLKVG